VILKIKKIVTIRRIDANNSAIIFLDFFCMGHLVFVNIEH